ncbi:hypothetical protein COO60DRAFT_1498921, partial [Scenedesmus sp. NREL 46B-D3]
MCSRPTSHDGAAGRCWCGLLLLTIITAVLCWQVLNCSCMGGRAWPAAHGRQPGACWAVPALSVGRPPSAISAGTWD